jgi:hypothetical protein
VAARPRGLTEGLNIKFSSFYYFVAKIAKVSEEELKEHLKTTGKFEVPIGAKQEESILITKSFINGRTHSVLWDTGSALDIAGLGFRKEQPDAKWEKEQISFSGVDSKKEIDSSWSTSADITFAEGVTRSVKKLYSLDQYEGDIIIGNKTMKDLATVLVLTNEGSFVMIGDKKLKVDGYLSPQQVYVTSALVATRRKGKEAFQNEKQGCPTPETKDPEEEAAKKRKLTKSYAKKAIDFIKDKVTKEQNKLPMKGKVERGAYSPFPGKISSRAEINKILRQNWGKEPIWPKNNEVIKKIIREKKDIHDFTIIVPYNTKAYWWRDVVDRLADLPIPIPTSKSNILIACHIRQRQSKNFSGKPRGRKRTRSNRGSV